MRLLLISTLLLANILIAAPTQPKASIKTALKKIAAEDQSVLQSNPLRSHKFETFVSRSYLYFYRAMAYTLIAKKGPRKLENLDHALEDLRRAKESPNSDMQRINQLVFTILKDKIELLRQQKKYRAVIESIEQLSSKDKTESRYIIYYGEALFNSARLADFKKLVRNYPDLFNDHQLILKYISKPPQWKDAIALIPGVDRAISPRARAVLHAVVDRDALLASPQAWLGRLKKNVYFKDSDSIFKTASALYISLFQKDSRSQQEQEFVREFQIQMYAFSPAFVDSLIFSHWKLRELRKAELLCTSFLKQFEGHSLYPKVLFNLGRIQEDAKNYAHAAKTFQKFLLTSDDATYVELARFRLPWVLLLAQQETEAKPHFAEYIKNHPDGRYASTSEYFLIKLNAKNTEPEQHMALINNFIKKYPLNFYAYLLVDEYNLSNENIKQTLSLHNTFQASKANEKSFPDFKSDIKTLEQLALFHELNELGLREDAIKVLKNLVPDANNGALALYMASQFHSIEDTHGEVSSLIKAVANTSELGSFIPWKGLFPDYEVETIKKELIAQSSLISPLLVLSLIRQESAFNPRAVSTANAQGLMQLMPKTAQGAAKQLKIKDFSLLKEEDNLRLGIRTFDAILKKYNNRLDYALCAYNAGETATKLWISLRGHLEPLKFIESIPYPETRVYVKSILRNHAIYKMLYEPNPDSLVSGLLQKKMEN